MANQPVANPTNQRIVTLVTKSEKEAINQVRGYQSVSSWVRDAIVAKLAQVENKIKTPKTIWVYGEKRQSHQTIN